MASSERDADLSAALYAASRSYAVTVITPTTDEARKGRLDAAGRGRGLSESDGSNTRLRSALRFRAMLTLYEVARFRNLGNHRP
jgi:hypothetical protein